MMPAHDINQVLLHYGSSQPDQIAIRLIHAPGEPLQTFTYAELLHLARAGSLGYRIHGLGAGETVILCLPTGAALIAALLGAFWAGVIPTVMAPVQADLLRQCRRRCQVLNARAIVSDLALETPPAPLLRSETFVPPAYELEGNPFEPHQADAIAYVQFSSGSTGDPKGIALSWSSITTNITGMLDRLTRESFRRTLSWLPLFHDMGLFGGLLSPLYSGGCVYLMDSSQFARHPPRWIRLLSEHRCTLAVSPPSSLLAVLRLLERRPLVDVDLSAVEQFVVGAELVSNQLLELYQKVLVGTCSARVHALRPVYGLAESTLAVCIPRPGSSPGVDWIDAVRVMAQGQADPLPPGQEGALAVISTGSGLARHDLEIRDSTERRVAERTVGRIWIRGPSIMSGVYGPEGYRPRQEAWLDTGDRGYLLAGQLYVLGRDKDLIIKQGRSISPDHLEDIARACPGVRRVIAVGDYCVDRSTDRLVLLVECQHTETAAGPRDRLRLALRSSLTAHGFELDEVRFVPRNALPLTTSGKPRRSEAKARFLQPLRSGPASEG